VATKYAAIIDTVFFAWKIGKSLGAVEFRSSKRLGIQRSTTEIRELELKV
jgi:hypothetical protein